MRATLWTGLLICSVVYVKAATVIHTDWWYEIDRLQKNIQIRQLKKDWKPHGPSSKTDEVLDEYPWDPKTAFEAMKNSKWEYEKAQVKDAVSLFKNENYKQDRGSIIVIHPISSSADVLFVQSTITALTMRNQHKLYNIFAVDMKWNKLQMILSVALMASHKSTRMEPMARAVSKFLEDGLDGGHIKPEQIHLVGWSYSGQLSGYIARHIKIKYKSKIGSIIGLDPYFDFLNKDLYPLSKDDAHVVHIYHSNSLLAGTRERVGTADFIFNNGLFLPECRFPASLKNSMATKTPNACSHLKIVQRWWYTILYPSKFMAISCPSWFSMLDCLCEGNDTVNMRYPIEKDSKAKGVYYLSTTETKPYGTGVWGVTCTSEKRLLMESKREL